MVQTEIDESVIIWYSWEGCSVGDSGAVQAALVSSYYAVAIGPGQLGISRRVNGKYNVDMSSWLDQGMEGDVLLVFTAINDREGLYSCKRRRVFGISKKWIGLVFGNVIIGFIKRGQEVTESVLDKFGQVLAIKVQRKLVE